MQEIQFLEFMNGDLLQAFPNYLICMHFIRINTVTTVASVCLPPATTGQVQ